MDRTNPDGQGIGDKMASSVDCCDSKNDGTKTHTNLIEEKGDVGSNGKNLDLIPWMSSLLNNSLVSDRCEELRKALLKLLVDENAKVKVQRWYPYREVRQKQRVDSLSADDNSMT